MPRMPYTNFHDLNLNWFLKEFKKIIAAVSGKQDAPAQPGTAGQVLGLNEGLQPVWVDQEGGSQGTTDYTELENKPQINGITLAGNKTGSEYGVIDTPAAPGTAGQVLGLDASLTPKWIDQEGGSVDLDITGTASGAVASFDDGANNEPVQDLQIAIEPVQDLHGYSNPWPAGGGKNLLRTTLETRTLAGITATVKDDGSIILNGTSTDVVYFNINNSLDTTALSGKIFKANAISGVTYRIGASYASMLQNLYSGSDDIAIADNGSGLSLFVRINIGVTFNNTAIQPRIGNNSSAVSAWSPYSNICPISGWTGCNVTVAPTASADDPDKTIYPFIFPGEAGTVYGGTMNPVTGKLIVTDAEIESYNGETLPSTWISDRDVYAEGTTPTIGAQVVYKLAEPLEYDLSHTEIRTLLGNNNIWANTGDILQCVYKVDLDIYLRNVTKVKILTPAENTLTLKPFPTTYNFGERTALTLTVTSDTYYKFMFKCPANAVTNISINGANDTAGDIPAVGKTYIVEIWAGIANYTELVLAVG